MSYFRLWYFFVLIVICQVPMRAQDWVSYQSQQKINDLVDTGDQLLMATDAGLVVMNKATLEKTIYTNANSSLSNNHIQSITQAPNGDYWIGTYDVVMGRFDGSGFSDPIFPDSDEYDDQTKLYDFEIAPNGDFWLGTSDGVFHRQGQEWLHYDEAEMGELFFEAWDIEINQDGEVLIASHTIHKYTDGTWSNISDTTQLVSYLDAKLFFSNSGDLYIAGDLDEIGRFDGEQWQEIDNGGLNGSEVTGFAEDLDGTIYFYTKYDGVFKLEGEVWTLQEWAQTAAFDNNVNYFYIDQQGQRWLNDRIYLSVDRGGELESTLIAPHTLEVNSINNLHKGVNGTMYFVNNYNTVSVLDANGEWAILSPAAPLLPFERINDILVIANDNIWLATNQGLRHYDGEAWTLTELEACRSFAMDTQGVIYIRASDRIYLLNGDQVSEYNVANSPLSTHIISGIGVDANDNLWIAAFSWEGDNVIQNVTSDGTWTTYLGSDHPVLNNRPVGDFQFDNDGNVWVAADLVGAIKFDGQNFTNPIQENISNLENYNAFSIESDSEGRMYFAHQYGVTTLLDGEWENLIIDDVPNVNSSHGSLIQFDNAGTLWWASSRYGVFSYTPALVSSADENLESSIGYLVYPNPANDYAILQFTVKEKAQASAFIFNQLGQLVTNIDFGQLPAGAFQRSLDFFNYPKGIYQLRLQINGTSTTQTLIVQ
jgi:ligand-binding sensor domain-containing protein